MTKSRRNYISLRRKEVARMLIKLEYLRVSLQHYSHDDKLFLLIHFAISLFPSDENSITYHRFKAGINAFYYVWQLSGSRKQGFSCYESTVRPRLGLAAENRVHSIKAGDQRNSSNSSFLKIILELALTALISCYTCLLHRLDRQGRAIEGMRSPFTPRW